MTRPQLDQSAEYWWDELERLLLQLGRLPRAPHVVVGGQPYSWDLGESASYSAGDARCYRQWKASKAAPTQRHSLYQQLYDQLNPLDHVEREAVLARLHLLIGVERTARATNRSLTAEELRLLDRSQLIEIGAHTVNHPQLASLSVQDQTQEIQASKDRLKRF
jgi:peptidoglycan/xylan/chitin deacetylase (PgdA/CDA1 family)